MPRLTDELERSILSFIRAGGFPHVAAEAAGVPRALFDDWMSRPGPRYQAFFQAIRQAEAQARLRVEITVLDSKPLDWLRGGPGKPQPDLPGWTSPVRAAVVVEGSMLLHREFQELVGQLFDLLGDRPEILKQLSERIQA